MWSCVEEGLAADYRGAGAVGGGAALQFCQGEVDHGAVFDFFEGVLLAELRVGVALRVRVADAPDLGEVPRFGAVSVEGGCLVSTPYGKV